MTKNGGKNPKILDPTWSDEANQQAADFFDDVPPRRTSSGARFGNAMTGIPAIRFAKDPAGEEEDEAARTLPGIGMPAPIEDLDETIDDEDDPAAITAVMPAVEHVVQPIRMALGKRPITRRTKDTLFNKSQRPLVIKASHTKKRLAVIEERGDLKVPQMRLRTKLGEIEIDVHPPRKSDFWDEFVDELNPTQIGHIVNLSTRETQELIFATKQRKMSAVINLTGRHPSTPPSVHLAKELFGELKRIREEEARAAILDKKLIASHPEFEASKRIPSKDRLSEDEFKKLLAVYRTTTYSSSPKPIDKDIEPILIKLWRQLQPVCLMGEKTTDAVEAQLGNDITRRLKEKGNGIIVFEHADIESLLDNLKYKLYRLQMQTPEESEQYQLPKITEEEVVQAFIDYTNAARISEAIDETTLAEHMRALVEILEDEEKDEDGFKLYDLKFSDASLREIYLHTPEIGMKGLKQATILGRKLLSTYDLKLAKRCTDIRDIYITLAQILIARDEMPKLMTLLNMLMVLRERFGKRITAIRTTIEGVVDCVPEGPDKQVLEELIADQKAPPRAAPKEVLATIHQLTESIDRWGDIKEYIEKLRNHPSEVLQMTYWVLKKRYQEALKIFLRSDTAGILKKRIARRMRKEGIPKNEIDHAKVEQEAITEGSEEIKKIFIGKVQELTLKELNIEVGNIVWAGAIAYRTTGTIFSQITSSECVTQVARQKEARHFPDSDKGYVLRALEVTELALHIQALKYNIEDGHHTEAEKKHLRTQLGKLETQYAEYKKRGEGIAEREQAFAMGIIQHTILEVYEKLAEQKGAEKTAREFGPIETLLHELDNLGVESRGDKITRNVMRRKQADATYILRQTGPTIDLADMTEFDLYPLIGAVQDITDHIVEAVRRGASAQEIERIIYLDPGLTNQIYEAARGGIKADAKSDISTDPHLSTIFYTSAQLQPQLDEMVVVAGTFDAEKRHRVVQHVMAHARAQIDAEKGITAKRRALASQLYKYNKETGAIVVDLNTIAPSKIQTIIEQNKRIIALRAQIADAEKPDAQYSVALGSYKLPNGTHTTFEELNQDILPLMNALEAAEFKKHTLIQEVVDAVCGPIKQHVPDYEAGTLEHTHSDIYSYLTAVATNNKGWDFGTINIDLVLDPPSIQQIPCLITLVLSHLRTITEDAQDTIKTRPISAL